MKRLVWLVPVIVLVACAEREKQVEQAPPQPVTAEQPGISEKYKGMQVKKTFVGLGPAVGAASASAAPSAPAK
jgi:hypothetical protein